MFKQQLSPRSVHPYQTTVVPRSELQIASATRQRTKFPWAEDINPPVYQAAGTESSTSDNAYNVSILISLYKIQVFAIGGFRLVLFDKKQ